LVSHVRGRVFENRVPKIMFAHKRKKYRRLDKLA
jgi:hypothetical protein